MKRFILSVSVLSALLLAGQYGQSAATPVPVSVAVTAAPSVTKLPTASLPASIKSYLDGHFAGYAIVKVEKAFAGEGQAGLRSVGLRSVGLRSVGLRSVGLRSVGLRSVGLRSVGLRSVGLRSVGLRSVGLRSARPDSAGVTRTAVGTRVKILLNDVPFNLFFDAAGQFAGTHAPGPRGEVDKSAYLTANQLPASVRDYLSKTYKGYTFLKAETKPSPTGSVRHYNVEILTSDQRATLRFDSTGTFREAHVRAARPAGAGVSYLSRNALPAKVGQVVTSGYANQTYVMGEQRSGPNGTEYSVELAANNALTKLHFDADGNVVTRPTGPDSRGHNRPEDRDPNGKGPQEKGPKHGPGPDRPGQDRPGRNARPGQGGPREPRADASRQLLLNAGTLPAAVASYLNANFKGYTFLKADVHQANGTATDYTTDIAVGKGLYKLRFAANGDVLMAEARN